MTLLMPALRAAERLAREAHTGHYNEKAQEPYILHPQRVAGYVPAALVMLSEVPISLLVQRDLKAAAWLHDTVEDTPLTLAEIEADVGPEIAEIVDLLTKKPGQTLAEYYAAIKVHPEALVVKFADMMDNGDPQRLAEISDPAERERLTKKYADASVALGIEREYQSWQQQRASDLSSSE